MTAELAAVDQQIAAAETENARYSGELIKALIEAILKQTRAVLDQRRLAGVANVTVRYTVDGKVF